MSSCDKCGTELPGGSRVCPTCGAEVPEQPAAAAPDPQPESAPSGEPEAAKAEAREAGGDATPPPAAAEASRSRRRLPLIIGALVVLAVLVGGVLLFWRPSWEVAVAQDGYAVSGESTHGFVAEVANVGHGSGTYSASYAVDGTQLGDFETEVAGGETAQVELTVPGNLALGEHTLTVGDVTQSFEVVEPAAFEVQGIKADPRVVRKGDTISFEAKVSNTGGAAGSYDQAPKLGGKSCQSSDWRIAPDETETVVFETTASRAGTFTVRLGGKSCKATVVKPVRLTNGHVIVRRVSGGLGQLKIKNGNSTDGMAVLTKSGSKSTVLSVYVRAKKKCVLKGIPNGKYSLYYSLGEDWNWHMRDFFDVSERGKFAKPFNYSTSSSSYTSGNYLYTNTKYTVWSVTLNPVAGGSAQIKPVSAGGMPK